MVAMLEQASPIGGTHPTRISWLTNSSIEFFSSSRGIRLGWVVFVETGRSRSGGGGVLAKKKGQPGIGWRR